MRWHARTYILYRFSLHRLVGALFIAAFTSTVSLAIEPATVPTAAAGIAAPLCTIGQACTFAAPVFACDYAGSEKIAAAGPSKGSVIGTDLVREKTCQIVAAGRPVTTEATKTAQIVYLTEAGQHLGYTPAGVFAIPSTIKTPTVPFPRELWGRWFDSRRACSDRGRDRDDYETHGVLVVSEWGRSGNRAFEFPQRISVVKRISNASWEIDGAHDVDGLDEAISTTTTYSLTQSGLAVKITGDDATTNWVRCR